MTLTARFTTQRWRASPRGARGGYRRRRIALLAMSVMVAACGQQAERGADGGNADTPPASDIATTDAPTSSPANGSDGVVVLRMGDGTEVRFPTGQPAILYFMSTLGCVECEPGAIALQDVDAAIDVVALEVIPDTPADWLDNYRRALRLDYPVVQDPDGIVAGRYGVTDLSVAIAVDGEGIAVTDTFDPTDPDQLAAALEPFDIAIEAEPPTDVDTSDA